MGLSSRQLQQFPKRTRLLRKKGFTDKSSGVVTFVKTKDGTITPVIKDNGVVAAKTVRIDKHLQRAKRYVSTIKKPKHSIASIITEAVRQSFIDGLDIKILKAKPEIAYAIGSVVAARAICIARAYGAAGCIAGGVSDFVDAIGSASLDIKIIASGAVTVKVSTKPTTKRKSRKKKNDVTANSSEQTSGTQSKPEAAAVALAGGGGGGDDDDDNETVTTTANQHIVIRDQNGVTHIHIDKLQFLININAQLVDQLIVNPKEVINLLQSQFTGLKGAIDANSIECKVINEPK